VGFPVGPLVGGRVEAIVGIGKGKQLGGTDGDEVGSMVGNPDGVKEGS
jgi:hypothetical protein